ncbi:zinc-dependent alcohol dehydrogenase family protein [Pelosinus sp. sgz500959]|uniref:zinc-dependent alcohol dehydrogenase family protein n=1 Tax=Pelosinus sp. sgz500959 TaxID=3242472 RepID=UPI00366E5135
MKAMVIRNYGGPEVFEIADMNKPDVKPGYALVKVAASSINPIETKIRSGLVPGITPAFPAILNADFSGEIVALGDNISQWNIGDEVFGCAGGVGSLQGALADYMLVDVNLIGKKPTTIDHATAALFPLVSITAWEALREKVHVNAGDKVLIHGIAGGVGHIGLQLAKHQGAVVYGTVRSEKQAVIAKDLGVDVVIFSNEESVEEYVEKHTDGKGFDIVLDPVGGDNLINSFKAVKHNGSVCTTNARVTLDLGIMHAKAISLHAVFMLIPLVHNLDRKRHRIILHEISNMIEKGQLRINRDERQFSFHEIGEAHRYMESGKAFGKVSLINSFTTQD